MNNYGIGTDAPLSVVDRRAESAAVAMAADRHLRVVGGKLLGHFVGGVVRAVVDDEHAEFRRQLTGELEDFVDAFPQPRFAIVNGQYDGQRLIQHASLQ